MKAKTFKDYYKIIDKYSYKGKSLYLWEVPVVGIGKDGNPDTGYAKLILDYARKNNLI